MKKIFANLIPAIRRCGWMLTIKGDQAVIHHLSPNSKKNIGLFFELDDKGRLKFDNAIRSRFRNTVSHMTSIAPEYRYVYNKQDALDALVVLIKTGLLQRLGGVLGQPSGAGRRNVPFVVNRFYKGGLNDAELLAISNDIYNKAAAIAAAI